ncbi:MAG: glycosyl hydrolase [Candidatus Aminicenantes bacterium]|nr:glycosyl hydrolase [Candidatus Aminicenantes bacterium]
MKRRRTPFLVLAMLLGTLAAAAPESGLEEFSRVIALRRESPFRGLSWKNLGPFYCGGRVVDIEGYAGSPGRFWVATATGGLWLTEDGGQSWRGCFEREATASIGDIAVGRLDEALVWLGSGESNAQGQSYPGCGVFKSGDGGRSWRHMGLAATRHVGRVLIDPGDSDTVYVAAMGSLFHANPERGVYKSVNGGRSWEKVLFVSERTGVVDLAMEPGDSNVLYAAAWQRERQPWDFSGSGPESGVYKTSDGGRTWVKLVSGLPSGPHVGRVGLAVGRSNPKVVYALVDNQKSLERGGRMNGIRGLVRRQGGRGAVDPEERRFDPNIVGAEVYRSDDAGAHWRKVNGGPIEEMYFTYGFYFGQIRVAPDDAERIYLLGVSLQVSADGGRTYERLDSGQLPFADARVHRDHHALWIDPGDPRRLLLGNDGGVNLSADGGKSWSKVANLSISQCYTVIADDERPATVFIGTQDNGVLAAPLAVGDAAGPPLWRMLLGGDGAFVAPLAGDPPTLLAAAQFGALVRLEAGGGAPTQVKPKPPRLFEPYRFNWLAPLLTSPRRTGEVFFAANKVLRSLDRGSTWQEISPDLSNMKNTGGDTPYATVTALAASELAPGLLYAGTDDGNVWVRTGNEKPWRKVSQALPGKWVSRIVASRHRSQRVFLVMNGRMQGDDRAYLFESENLGLDWKVLRGNLPAEPLNALAEDPEDEDLLYLGSDRGLYASLDAGSSWLSLQGDLPTVPVSDLFIYRRDRLMLVATFGRGLCFLPLSEIKKRLPAAAKS